MGRVAGKVALVTGGGLGLGRAAALMLAREGAKVVVADVKDEEGAKVADEIVDSGGEAMFLHHDVAQEADWDRVVRATVERFGGLQILVINAGVALGGDVEHTSLAEWRWLIESNNK